MGNKNIHEKPPKYKEKISIKEIKERNELEEKRKNYELYTIFRSILLERISKGHQNLKPHIETLSFKLNDLDGFKNIKEKIVKKGMKPFKWKGVKITPLEIFVYARCEKIDPFVKIWNKEFGESLKIISTNYNAKSIFIRMEIVDDSFEIEI